MKLVELQVSPRGLSEEQSKIISLKVSYIGKILFNNLPIVNEENLRKIVIELVSRSNHNNLIRPSKFSPVAILEISFDYDKLFAADNKKQNKIILDAVMNGLNILSENLKWNYDLFLEGYKKVLDSDFKDIRLLTSIKFSANKKTKATIEVNQIEDQTVLSIVFFDKDDSMIKKVPFFYAQPHEFFYGRFLKKRKWLNNDEFRVSDTAGEVHYTASIVKDDFNVLYTPIGRDENGLKEELKFISK